MPAGAVERNLTPLSTSREDTVMPLEYS